MTSSTLKYYICIYLAIIIFKDFDFNQIQSQPKGIRRHRLCYFWI